jgi:dihydroorotate dehydrogenase subfamily 2
MGKNQLVRKVLSEQFAEYSPSLDQELFNIHFRSPIGLAAGFDYEARLTQITGSLGFGFHTVGTITSSPSQGNPSPQLGRLPKSQSLMVNKGFKNPGALATAHKLSRLSFPIPVGISVGRTNSSSLSQKQSVSDILHTFFILEKAQISHAYYELNISCPNLKGDVTFYTKKKLDELLSEVDKLHIKRPLFIKMPITLPNKDTLTLLSVIADHSPKGVIIGNLQKDRRNPALVQSEVSRFEVGSFSGKPTYVRSNELIRLTRKHFHKKLVIIGCGGISSGSDAYQKIKYGASLVQLITGMIFKGPQLIYEINNELPLLLKKDGLNHLRDAIGVEAA